ncbi:MAG: SH3 domain-containing protein [Clostridia bacterium]|nr:SH3 domain-containing protein [Clostridia bacterium]
MQKTHLYKRCLRAGTFALALAMPLSSMAETHKVVHGGMLNLRQEPSLGAKVIKQYPTGTWMTVLSEEGEWSKVEVGGNTGYVMSKYLKDENAASTLHVRTNTGRGLNLRDEPSLEGSIITSFKPGTAVSVLVRGQSWHKVSVNGQIGYMSAQYLTGSSGSGSSTTHKTGTVSNPGANQVLLLRETASTDARVIGQFRNGTKVTILGESGDFYKVTVGGKNGYMMKKFISVSSSSALPQTPFTAKLINPNGNSIVNFRTAPGLNASVIKAHPVGKEIKVLETGDVWCKAEIDGVTGYVSRYFFKVVK